MGMTMKRMRAVAGITLLCFWFIFFNRPIAGFFMVLALASIATEIWLQVRSHAPEIAIDDADE